MYRTLAALGVPRSVYYAWKRRASLVDKMGAPCRVYELLPEERSAICEFALEFPNGVRGGKHGLPGVERCGSAVALEAFGGLER